MIRSNIDKPFFVDVGTSIAAVRCQSNRDVLDRFDHVRLAVIRANDKAAPYRRKLFLEEKCDLFRLAAIKAF